MTAKVLSELKTRAKDAESYATFWQAFGPVLKEGLWEDAEHRQDIANLLRFHSSTQEGWTSLADYVARMKPNQEAIYILVGDDVEALKRSAQIEGFTARGLEVLLLSDHVDAFWPERMDAYEGKPIRSITQGGDDLSAFEPEVAEGDTPADLADLLPKLKEALKDDVSDVKASQRLVDSAVLLSAPAFGPDLQMQRLLRRAGRGMGGGQPVLELNPRHPLIRRIAERAASGEDVGEAAQTLVDLAHVQGGDPPRDPVAFARRVASALAQG